MKRHIIVFIFIAPFFLSMLGCATIVSGTKQTVSFQSQPEGATVTVDGEVMGKTPVTVSIKKQENPMLTFEKEGYQPIKTNMSTSLNGWFWGNIVIGGFFGSTTDAVSGSMHEYAPDSYFVTLTPLEGTDVGQQDKVKAYVIANNIEIREALLNRDVMDPALGGLFELLQVPPTEISSTTTILSNLAAANDTSVKFADAIINRYFK